VNNTELELGDDDYYYYDDDDARAVVQLADFQYPFEMSMLSHNQFSNPEAIRELSVDVRLPPTFVLDLGLNFWDRTNYSAVIQRYV